MFRSGAEAIIIYSFVFKWYAFWEFLFYSNFQESVVSRFHILGTLGVPRGARLHLTNQ